MDTVEARKRLLYTGQGTGGITETARRWHTPRQVVRKWVKTVSEAEGGEAGQPLATPPLVGLREGDENLPKETELGRLSRLGGCTESVVCWPIMTTWGRLSDWKCPLCALSNRTA